MKKILPNVFKVIVEKLRGEENEIEVNKIEYPPKYYEKTRDIKENLLMYEEVIKKIQAKYAPYSFERAFREKFGEELSDVDFIYKDRIKAYSERNNVSEEQLQEFKKEITPMRQKVCKKINEEIELAQYHVLLRDGQRVSPEVVELEKKYGKAAKAEELKKKLGKNSAESPMREVIRVMVLTATMNTIKANIKPYGKEPEPKYKDDWIREIDYVEAELSKKGLDIKSYGNDDEIDQAWGEICHVTKNERSARIYSMDEFFKRAQEESSKKETLDRETSKKIPPEKCLRERDYR